MLYVGAESPGLLAQAIVRICVEYGVRSKLIPEELWIDMITHPIRILSQ